MAARGMLITIALQRAVASISGTGRTRTKKTTVMTMAAMTDLAQLDTSLKTRDFIKSRWELQHVLKLRDQSSRIANGPTPASQTVRERL
jgi:hypothetical protein